MTQHPGIPIPHYRIVNLDRGCELAAHVEIAGESRARRRGLLAKSHLDEAAGVWIAPCEAIHTFGMKMPIDVVFLDRKHRARKLVRNLGPARIALCLAGSSVLELASGAIARSGLQAGDQLQFQAIRPTV